MPNEGYHFDRVEFYEKTGAGENDLIAADLTLTEENTFTMPDYDVVLKVFFAAHTYGEAGYTWADDNSAVTASHTCAACGHGETETVRTTSAVTTPATCVDMGRTTYTATFTNSAFAVQTKEVENVDPIGHDWGAPTYVWDGNNCTATRVCGHDSAHTETETVAATAVTTAATCETAGSTVYTAVFGNQAFETQTKTVEIPAAGHSWGEPSYEWAQNGEDRTCTATRVCANDASHVETETVTATYAVTTEPTTASTGVGTYTATFANAAFVTQTSEVEIPMLEPDTITITLDPCNGGESAAITVEIPIGGSIETFPEVAYAGHKLIGWFTEAAANAFAAGTGVEITAETVFNEAATIYAHWYLPGDINGDTRVNNKDITMLLSYVKYHDVEVVMTALDVNGDGKVNNKDITWLLSYVKYHDVEIY